MLLKFFYIITHIIKYYNSSPFYVRKLAKSGKRKRVLYLPEVNVRCVFLNRVLAEGGGERPIQNSILR